MGGKKDNSGGLGRALVRKHNQMAQQSKERGHALRLQQRKVLESFTDISDIDAVIEQAEEAALLYSAENPSPTLSIDLDGSRMTLTAEERRRLQIEEEALHASSLRVPRRPPWNPRMSAEELDVNERQAFLVWRRSLARLEENEKLVITPFEKNIDIWRQLWRVLERSDLLVMVVDARDPLFYRCPDLEAYAQEIDEHKRTMLLVNKADLLPLAERKKWAKYFKSNGILFIFWSAKSASAILEGKLSKQWEEQSAQEFTTSDVDSKIYGRDELLARLQTEAKAIVSSRKHSTEKEIHQIFYSLDSTSEPTTSKHVVVGFVGYPNVGKSSTINAVIGGKRTGVTSTPGKTKHFQTLIISDELILCDCPGLVFPSFSSSRYEMIASGVLPVDRMTEHREAVQVVANNVPRHLLEKIYNIKLSKPKPYELQTRPPTAAELLRAYCLSRGHTSSSGLPDETRAARQILKDYINGKITHFKLPPETECDEDEEENNDIARSDDEPDECESNEEEESSSLSVAADFKEQNLKNVFDDLDSLELSGAVVPNKATAAGRIKKVKSSKAKNHKKPQRKKDRSWRVGNDDGDGMPIVRVFQKPAVNWAGIRAST